MNHLTFSSPLDPPLRALLRILALGCAFAAGGSQNHAPNTDLLATSLLLSKADVQRMIGSGISHLNDVFEPLLETSVESAHCPPGFENYPRVFGNVDAPLVVIQRPTRHQEMLFKRVNASTARKCFEVENMIKRLLSRLVCRIGSSTSMNREENVKSGSWSTSNM
jgi:hypothetical protein